MTTAELGRAVPGFRRLDPGLAIWIAVFAFTALCLALSGAIPWLSSYPSDWIVRVMS